MILPAFFARVKPVSTMAKPHCMKNTKTAPIKNQTDISIRFHTPKEMTRILQRLAEHAPLRFRFLFFPSCAEKECSAEIPFDLSAFAVC
jgi:hypothetical protein